MAESTAEMRGQLLDGFAEAVERIAVALAALGDAYELLDEDSADRLEEGVFRPAQLAFGRAQRTYTDFAARSGLAGRQFAPASIGRAGAQVRERLDDALEAVEDADATLGELQDSMLPVEVGDPELRAGLAEVRRALGDAAQRLRQFTRLVGR
jgi:hypothetical protein